MKPRMPNLLIIGAARSGTSSVYQILNEHPDVFMAKPPRPEPHFFLKSNEYARGVDYYLNRWFQDWAGEKIGGEKSASYLFDENVPDRILRHCPKVKLIAVLRNPLERAYSNYRVSVGNGLETRQFADALDRESGRTRPQGDPLHDEIQPFAYLGRSRYARQLRRYFDRFEPTQIHILLLDDLISDALSSANRIYDFLGVDTEYSSSCAKERFNAAKNGEEHIPRVASWVIEELLGDVEEVEPLIGRKLTSWKRSLKSNL